MQLVIASSNAFKIGELRKILQSMLPQVQIRSLLEFPDIFPPTFGHQTFEQNAADKATYVSKMTGIPAVSDESGLVVPYLGGYSASMKSKSEQKLGSKLPNVAELLNDLQNVDDHCREAFLECCLAFACPKVGLVKVVSSRLEGYIATREKGPASFDFASIFVKHEYSTTLAAMPQSVYERISHRLKACEKLRFTLNAYFVKQAHPAF
jgi:XTP/dITP diphosphohydrolase